MSFDFKMETNTAYHKKTFEWKIRNFSKIPGDRVESPSFFPVAGSAVQLQVVLVFLNPKNSLCWYVHLKKVDVEKTVPPVAVTGNVSFKNSEGKLWLENPFSVIMEDENIAQCCSVPNNGYKLPGSINCVFGLSDDIFVVEWSMTVSVVTSIITPVSILPRVESKEVDMSNILKVVYEKSAFTDFTFHFSKDDLRAHKAILSARSPVLEKMFEHDTLEKQTNSVSIEDVEFRVFDCFIGFIYTNEIRDDIKTDVDSLLALYEVADKYEVSDLQKSCADILLSDFLSVKTVCKILYTADMHHDDSFKEAVMHFLRPRFSEVTKRPEWGQFLRENVALASEIVAFVTELVNK